MKKNIKTGTMQFQNQKEFERIYESFLENRPSAASDICRKEKEMDSAFKEYLAAYNEDTFRYAYQFGYEAGLKGGVGA